MGSRAALLLPLVLALVLLAAADYRSFLPNAAERLAKSAKAVAAWTACSGTVPWELGDLEEGDIMPSGPRTRVLEGNDSYLWPRNFIPFNIETMDFNETQVQMILSAINLLNSLSCLQLKYYPPKNISKLFDSYVRITGKEEGCWANVGRVGGEQIVNLQPPQCFEWGTPVHELMHAMGFHHMHNNPDRDDYLIIYWEFIDKDKRKYLQKHKPEDVIDWGLRYDYNSIMHGHRKIYSNNRRDTLHTKLGFHGLLGCKFRPSELDIRLLNRRYCE